MTVWLFVVGLLRGALGLVRGLWASTAGRYALISWAAAIGLIVLVAVVAHQARKGVADHVQAQVVAKVQKATTKETVRREAALRQVQVRSAADVAQIRRLQAERAKLLEEIDHASVAHDGDACLGPDSVRRLQALRPPEG
jgi:hypothetical protein